MRRAYNETWRAGIIGSEAKNEERCKLCNMLINFQRDQKLVQIQAQGTGNTVTDLKFY